MKLTEKQQLLIQEYLSDNLSDDHQIEFSQQVKDPDFRRSLWVQANVLDGLQKGHEDKLRKHIEKFGEDGPSPIQEYKRKNYAWLKYAAIIIAVVGALFIYKTMMPTHQEEHQVLFAKYYQPYPAEDISRGGEDQIASLQYIMEAYAKEDYKLTLEEAKKVSSSEEARIYELIALIELDKVQETTELIAVLKNSTSPINQDVAEWYELLLLVKQNRIDEAYNKSKVYAETGDHLFQREMERLTLDLAK